MLLVRPMMTDFCLLLLRCVSLDSMDWSQAKAARLPKANGAAINEAAVLSVLSKNEMR